MRYTVPKYLERETKIVLGLTFKKLVILGCIGIILFMLKFFLPKVVWYSLVFLSLGLFFLFSFLKIGGQNFFELFINSFRFLTSANIYTWGRKTGSSPVKLVKRVVDDRPVKASPLKIAPQSRLSGLKSRIDLGGEEDNEQ